MNDSGDRFDRELLDAFVVPEPSRDLADRFFAGLGERRQAARRRRRRAAVLLGGAGLVAAVAAVVIIVEGGGRTVHPESGRVVASVRTTVPIGTRAVAVVEPGAHLSWSISRSGAIRIDQAHGNVFYRAEAGASFAVATPAGEVVVRGTCFRVEVEQMKTDRGSIVAATAGPAPSAAVLVTVYEGKVLLANEHGRVELAAGEAGLAVPDAPPRPSAGDVRIAGLSARGPPPAGATVEELLARDRAQREQIARLEAKLARAGGAARDQNQPDGTTAPKRPFEMSRDELAKLAATCDAPLDLPPVVGSTIMDQILEEGLDTAKFSDSERAAVRAVIDRMQPGYTSQLQTLYGELTGEQGEALDPIAIILEIMQKSPSHDVAEAKKKVAAERAGLRPPPADPRAGTVIERYLRLGIASGDAFATALADQIGANRTREFRRTWGVVTLGPGCPEEDRP